jgi:CBS-domain-containing membrane protein
MSNIFEKMRGDGAALPPKPKMRDVGFAWLGGFITLLVIAGLADCTATALVLGSFGASCVLVFAYPDVPFSQPRNVVFGHLFSSAVGLVFALFLGQHWWSVALAVGTAIAVMMLTRTVHPPAGSNPVIVFLAAAPSWKFLLFPTLLGAILLVLVALVYNNATREGKYPKYW